MQADGDCCQRDSDTCGEVHRMVDQFSRLLALKDLDTKERLTSGWEPLLEAMRGFRFQM